MRILSRRASHHQPTLRAGAAALLAATALMGCGKDRPRVALDAIQLAPEAGAEAVRANDPDWRFLRTLRDHHARLVALVHSASTRARAPRIRDVARRADLRNDVQTDRISGLLRHEFADSSAATDSTGAMLRVDSLLRAERIGYDDALVRVVAAHDSEAVRLIDQARPTLRRAGVRAAAEAIRLAKLEEIRSLRAGP